MAARSTALNTRIRRCIYENSVFPFTKQAESLFSVCCICALGSCFSSKSPRRRTRMILHLTTWLPIRIPRNRIPKGWFHPNEAPTGKAWREPASASFPSSCGNAQKYRQTSKDASEPNVFHRYIHTVNVPGSV